MNEILNNPTINWKSINNKEVLYFTFQGTFKEDDAKQGVKTWNKLTNEKKGKKELVWNCKDLVGYEAIARSIWQRSIKELKNEIEVIWLISESTLILGGAKIMSIFTSINIKAVKSEAEITSKFN